MTTEELLQELQEKLLTQEKSRKIYSKGYMSGKSEPWTSKTGIKISEDPDNYNCVSIKISPYVSIDIFKETDDLTYEIDVILKKTGDSDPQSVYITSSPENNYYRQRISVTRPDSDNSQIKIENVYMKSSEQTKRELTLSRKLEKFNLENKIDVLERDNNIIP